MKTIALVLAGGSGTRIWPLSRQKMPKQLLALLGNRSMLQETCLRIQPLVPPEDQWVIGGLDLYEKISEQIDCLQNEFLTEEQGKAAHFIEIMAEPMGKNTAPAIFWAARRCQQLYGDDTVLLVLPADHMITHEQAFIHDLQKGIKKAAEGYLLTFGISPVYAQTAYGYIKTNPAEEPGNEPLPVEAFVEKPDAATAQKFLDRGNYFWNSGMFAFHVGTLLAEGHKLCPETLDPFLHCEWDHSASVLRAYEMCKAQSIDCAL
ncbi:MAG: mannose-1-phosphate guanylyltransferase, partial [Methanobacterium sp.]